MSSVRYIEVKSGVVSGGLVCRYNGAQFKIHEAGVNHSVQSMTPDQARYFASYILKKCAMLAAEQKSEANKQEPA